MKKTARRLWWCVAWLMAGAGLGGGREAWAVPPLAGSPGTAITFQAAEQTPYFVMVRGKDGALVRCLASAAGASGSRTLLWDGKDSAGREAAAGTYRVFVSKGLTWELDREFGKAGRLGKYETETVVRDASAPIAVPGVLDRMAFSGIIHSAYPDVYPTSVWPVPVFIDKLTVNGMAYGRANDFNTTNTSFVLRDAAVTINPAGVRPGDTVRIVSYDTCFLQNPWDLAVGEDGSLYVLLRWRDRRDAGFVSSLVKLAPDGRRVDTAFGVDGEIPFLTASSQVILAPQENRLYIAGSHWGSWGTGSFKLSTGAFWLYCGDSGNDPACTYLPAGICLGRGPKIYIGDLKVYDRTKRLREGFLYPTTVKTGVIRPGPSMEKAPEEDMFYRTGWSVGVAKMRDTGNNVSEAYSLALPHKVIGISLDPTRRLIYAGVRECGGVVLVLHDDGAAFQEVARLEDSALGAIHTVRCHGGYLYVMEDGTAFTAEGYNTAESGAQPATPAGKNRISRYKLAFGREQKLAEIRKP